MKKSSRLRLVIGALLPLIAIVYMGCEDEPSDGGLDSFFDNNPYISDPRTSPSSLTISPAETYVNSVGETIRFSVIGGQSPYTWQVAKPSVGSVQGLPDDSSGVYTAVIVEDNNVIVADRNGEAAIANIFRESRQAMEIIPSSITLSNMWGEAVQFVAVGGAPPYSDWTLSQGAFGTIEVSGSSNEKGLFKIATPDPLITGSASITVKDSRDNVAIATVNVID